MLSLMVGDLDQICGNRQIPKGAGINGVGGRERRRWQDLRWVTRAPMTRDLPEGNLWNMSEFRSSFLAGARPAMRCAEWILPAIDSYTEGGSSATQGPLPLG